MSLDAMLNILKVPLYVLRCQPVFIKMCPTEYLCKGKNRTRDFLVEGLQVNHNIE